MSDHSTPARHPIDAGDFRAWMQAMTASLRGEQGNDVPCGDCVGCCSSYWPIALREGDAAALADIPSEHVIDPPNAPPGIRYMGYRDDGTCPMLVSGRCTIYSRRPQTCRDFDCRLFAAAGLSSAGADKPLINARIQAWQFTYAHADDRAAHDAMQAAAAFLAGPAKQLGLTRLPTSPIAIAGFSFKAYRVFLDEAYRTQSPRSVLDRMIDAARAFERSADDDLVTD